MCLLSFLLASLLLFVEVVTCYRLGVGLRPTRFSHGLAMSKDDFFSGFKKLISGSSMKESAPAVSYENEISEAREVLLRAAKKDEQDTQLIVKSLLDLEKLMRKQNSADGGDTANKTIEKLNGEWRLVFTTGTVDTQKKIGRINYFPLNARQTFDTTEFKITNGIYLTDDLPIIKFFGPFEFNLKMRKVIFDFDQIQFFGLSRINLPKGGAAKIGQSTGLGSENNIDLIEQGKKPFFNWISADDEIATARGGGGGLALWRRVV